MSFDKQLDKVRNADGFLAALDQSGGSTPKALRVYGVSDDDYEQGEASMFDAVHDMRTRIMTSPSFAGDRILGAILFEDTMDRYVEGIPTAEYLWEEKHVVPFLKVDKGLLAEEKGVQLMKPMPNLDGLLKKASEAGIFGTKMRSVIKHANPIGIADIVEQQFKFAKRILAAGLIPILEPEVDIHSDTKAQIENMLKQSILEHMYQLKEGEFIMLKLTLPCVKNQYKELAEHPKCLRVVALSGGYSRDEANKRLALQSGMIASFSRALTEGLNKKMTDQQFDVALGDSIGSIFDASRK